MEDNAIKWNSVLSRRSRVRNYQYTKTGVKLLNVGNFVNNVLELDNTDRYISEEEAYGKYEHFLVDERDLLIACSGIKAEYFDEKIAFAEKNTHHYVWTLVQWDLNH